MERPFELAVSVVKRNRKGTVIERAFIRFKEESHYNQFRKILSDHTSLEFHTVRIRGELPSPDGPRRPGTLWCPYCSDWRKFYYQDGYYKCEICTISTDDFYTKRYNQSVKGN